MNRRASIVWLALAVAASGSSRPGLDAQTPRALTLDQVLSFPFPENLVAAATGSKVAWTLNVKGVRNVYAADGPDFAARRLTNYDADDGQELTHLAFSSDGRYLVYVRGGNHAANRSESSDPPNPSGNTIQPKMEVWSIATSGGPPRLIGEGDAPAVAPRTGRVAFLKDGRLWIGPVDASTPPQRVADEGISASLTWSPDGSRLAFGSDHDGHASIAIFTAFERPIRYLAASDNRDSAPSWSPDAKLVAFVRESGVPVPLTNGARPWAIWIAGADDGSSRQVWKSSETLADSLPPVRDRARLLWAAGNRILFLSSRDGWPHVYAVASTGGGPRVLTPGKFMVEEFTVAPDRRTIFYTANTGADPDDGERRHLFKIAIDSVKPVQLTKGKGIEWSPVPTGDGKALAFLGSEALRPPLPQLLPLDGRPVRALAEAPPDFPAEDLVRPEHVVLQTTGGVRIHAQLFKAPTAEPRPAIVFLHGGPAQQMLLGWHYNDYYAHAYAVNQYLAHRGFVVLALNYRLGIGYGHAFQFPEQATARGSVEYDDVVAAGRYLQGRADVDGTRVGVWGLSYGGYLTSLALGRTSGLFAAGVDVHGVHDLVMAQIDAAAGSEEAANRFPWRSPILLVHADDDRNVSFSETVDFERVLTLKGVPVESRVIPDDVHDFLRFGSWRTMAAAAVDFFERWLVAAPGVVPR